MSDFIKKFVCIECPKGCNVFVYKDGEEYSVKGNGCIRGKNFAISELLTAKRVVTSTVATVSKNSPRLSVKTSEAVLLSKIFEVMRKINSIVVDKNINIGDVIEKNIDNDGSDLISTNNYVGD